jgi:protein involved in polysaccharide export with SLBB domain/capsular polysaccharide biosynthesis protein
MEPLAKTNGAERPENAGPGPRIDFWMVLDLLAERWPWLVLGALVCGVAAWAAATKLVGPKFTATGQLLRYETPGVSDFLKPETPMSPDTFAGLIRSPELLRRLGEDATPPIPPEQIAKQIKVDPDSESDLVSVSFAARTPQQAVTLLNIYLTNSAQYLRDVQSQQVRRAADTYLSKEVRQMDADIAELDAEFHALAMPPQITNKVAQIGGQLSEMGRTLAGPQHASPMVTMETEHLNQALGELAGLLSKYTEIHPLVQEKRAEVQALKTQIAVDSTNAAAVAEAPIVAAPPVQTQAQVLNPEADIIRTKLLSLEQGRVELVNRQREAELYVANPPGVARVFAPATVSTVQSSHRRLKIALAGIVGAFLGLAGSLAIVVVAEFVDGHLKTADDVRRVTNLPVLTTLGDVANMDAEARSQWAFRAWTMLQGRLSPSPQHGFVCGFTSSSEGEGRTTWIRLLAEAASLTGFRVLTVATRPDGVPTKTDLPLETLQVKSPDECLAEPNSNALVSPAQVTDQLTGPNPQPVVHIPLPGWVWNRERRQQWREALEHWRKIENVVILVELPPAAAAETVLLGSSLPNLIWMARRGAEAASTRDQLQTLRHGRCNIVGAVLNEEAAKPMKKRFPRWIGCVAALACLAHLNNSLAQETNAESAEMQTNHSFSIVHPWQRAAWQEHLTLGPGDTLDFGLFGQPELTLRDAAIGPDGRISFLEARDIVASDLTIDELREALDKELAKYRRAPHTLVTPVAFRSKKYYMLGKVMVKGAYVLDRPMTVLEAIARAKGFESGLVDRSIIDMADFSHSFIARNGKRMPLDFQRLFDSGDLSQNLPVEPGDYIYIAGADIQEVYVVGQVRLPGPVVYPPGQTVISAITARGGFTDTAYHARVLVIRGSLDQPKTYVVDTADIVQGKVGDFRLQPKDIVFVSARPFVRAEQLADLATTAFIQGLITAWVDVKVVKPFNQ